MHLYRLIALEATLLLLSGCFSADTRTEALKKSDAEYRCQAMGYFLPDNADYDKCVASERAQFHGHRVGESPATTPQQYTTKNEINPYHQYYSEYYNEAEEDKASPVPK